MEPAGWATVVVSVVAMFSAIMVAMIQRARARQSWNGVERRTMERIASEVVNAHIPSCPNMAAIRQDLADFRGEVNAQLEGIRNFIVQLHGKP